MSSRVDWNRSTWILDRILSFSCPRVLSHFVSVPFHCIPWFFSGKGWQLTCVQHTRRLTRVQHTKYYLCASYNRAAHKNRSCAAHKIELACSTRKLTLVSHASSVRVTWQKYKNTHVLPHVSVRRERYHMYDIILEVISQAFIILGAIASQVLNVCCHCKPSHNQYLAFDTISFVIAMTAQCS